MTTDFYNLLLSDCALAAVLLALFFYVGKVSRGVRGIATWGVAHFLYSLGAAMLDGTAQVLVRAGNESLAAGIAGAGGLLACAGLVGLAWSIIQFVQQRALALWERALLPLCLAFSLVGVVLGGGVDAQGAAMSATEVIVLVVMLRHLWALRSAPDHVPARLMIVGCMVLLWLYGGDLLAALTGRYGPNPMWVNLDLSIWFLLNFCMLMLASFRAAEPLRRSALFDPLTGALNRRGLDNELQARGGRHAAEHGLAVIALDLDHFKAVNDDHGHEAGDLVLQRFSDVVRSCIRGDDLFARLGGEEFMLVLRDTQAETAQALAERIRQQVMGLEFAPSGAAIRVTVSLGVSFAADRNAPYDTLMRLADEALYAAKHKGRNRIEVRWLPA
ncbi:diguanylate cyclase (GGDEF)-like protein [Pseudoxanthomonas sp. 3HH-4]|uniref:GGDEF domain-containing protein n=1 Tax=Pseudoxanthomonas sp. 3HH-4 TaxID=1690214 RepID=UPI001154D8D8|nr:GGDEF domain-containing protein [Pseudoxanthomonas sp. 3HH-4]TQM16950.1 diguanylate cyclase (GGDEF)-like protein [Pseudoxanthomonas sp. 3HH-4]